MQVKEANNYGTLGYTQPDIQAKMGKVHVSFYTPLGYSIPTYPMGLGYTAAAMRAK